MISRLALRHTTISSPVFYRRQVVISRGFSDRPGESGDLPTSPENVKVYYKNTTYLTDIKDIKSKGILQGLVLVGAAVGTGMWVHWAPAILLGSLSLGMVSGTPLSPIITPCRFDA